MLQEPIKKVLGDDEWQEKISVTTVTGGGKYVKFTSNDFKLMEKIVKVFGPFKEATVKLSSASACISQAIPTITSMLHTLKPTVLNSDQGVNDLKRNPLWRGKTEKCGVTQTGKYQETRIM